MQKIKKNLPLVVILGILFVTGITFTNAFRSGGKLSVPVAFGDEEESDDEKDEVNNDSEDSDGGDEIDKEDEESDNEEENNDEEKSTEIRRVRATTQRTALQNQENDNEDEDKEDGDNEDENDAQEGIQELISDIKKIESRISVLSANGVVVTAFMPVLAEVKGLASQAQAIIATQPTQAEALIETADYKLERLKKLVKMTLGDEDENDDDNEDGDEAKVYKNEVAQFVHNLKEIGEIEGGIGQQVNVVAQAQNASVTKVEDSINEINDRGDFVKFLVGPNYGSIAEIQTAITENQTRIKVLTDLVVQVTDPVVKQVLQDQIKNFQQENTRLQAFVTESDNGVSLFGWLVKMFS